MVLSTTHWGDQVYHANLKCRKWLCASHYRRGSLVHKLLPGDDQEIRNAAILVYGGTEYRGIDRMGDPPSHFPHKNVHPPRRRPVCLPKPHRRLNLVRNPRRLPPQHPLPINPNPTLRLSIPTTRLRPPTCRRHQIQPGLPRRVCSHV